MVSLQPEFASKADFVRSLDPSTTVDEAIKLARTKGIKLKPYDVYVTRATDKRRGGPPKRETAAEESEPVGTKSNFIRSLPEDMPPEEIIKRAAEQGIVLGHDHIRHARNRDARKNSNGHGPKLRTRAPDASAAIVPAAGSSTRPEVRPLLREGAPTEQQFARLAIELGLERAGRVLGELRDRVDSLFTGERQ
jgi:hypothetical protein